MTEGKERRSHPFLTDDPRLLTVKDILATHPEITNIVFSRFMVSAE